MPKPTKLALGGIAIFAIGLAAYLSFFNKGNSKAKPDTKAEQVETVASPVRASANEDAQAAFSMPLMVDDDPVGTLVLDGQVVDEDDNPVAGATVILGAAPPRTAISEGDGSFSFDKLVSRRYPVYARSVDRVGGPVVVTLSESSDPVLVRMLPGGGIEIEVVDASETPIKGATITIPDIESLSVQTDEQGLAVLNNLPPGHSLVTATAPGFARTSTLVTIPRSAETKRRQRVTMMAGVSVSGTIFRADGQPLMGAHVIARPVGTLLQVQDPRRDGVASDKDGRFVLPAVPAGGAQLFAIHDDFAPTTGERFSVADKSLEGIDLKMREGASLAGRVRKPDGQAAGWSTVRVVSGQQGGAGGGGLSRQMIADQDGSFQMKGLPRQALIVHASSEMASSESLDVDLRTTSKIEKLDLVLNVDGIISGVVVDEAGEPIAEAQVQATPDFWEGADLSEMRIRGPAFATTAGDGSFSLRGLPQLKVRIVASRGLGGPGGSRQGVAAQTGDTNVRVVLASPGRIVGKIQKSDGSTPGLAMVSIGWEAGVPTSNGRFELREVPPGNYELSVRGPDFATTYRPNVEVASGETLDLGTLSVEKGRSIRGRVLHKGNPVAGAQIALATQLISDGSSLTPRDLGDAIDKSNGVRRATSDANGGFTLRGIGKVQWTIAADHAELGRSQGYSIAPGLEDVVLDLELHQVGSVRGRVSVNGEPRANIQVLLTATQSDGQHILVVATDETGQFFAERVASGEHKVSAMLQASAAASMAATTVTIQPGQETEANLNIEEGSVTLNVTVAGVDDATIDAAQVFLFKGVARVQTGAELNKLFLSSAANAKMSFAMADGKAAFEKVSPDSYSLCVIPINGDMNDPAFGQKLQRHVNEIAVYCQLLDVEEAPENQSHIALVPPMTPLPEDG